MQRRRLIWSLVVLALLVMAVLAQSEFDSWDVHDYSRKQPTVAEIQSGAAPGLIIQLPPMQQIGSGQQAATIFEEPLDLTAATAPGEPAPPLEVEEVLQGPEPAAIGWESLKGTAVVLEFWATWCGPCLVAIPHWNQLVQEFEGEPVRFLSVSDEPPETLRTFLQRRRLDGWVAVDKDRSMFAAYGVEGIPHTFLIDGQGVIRGVTDPLAVTVDSVRRLTAGEDPGVEPRMDVSGAFAALDEEGPEPLVRFMVRPSRSSVAGTQSGSDVARGNSRYRAVGIEARLVLMNAFGVSRSRMVLEGELPEGVFDVVMETSGYVERQPDLLQKALEAAFQVEARWEKREVDVFRLVRVEAHAPGLVAVAGGSFSSSGRWGSLAGTSLTADQLASAIEARLDRPVLDATGLSGHYDVNLTWDPEVSADLERVLREYLGLALEEDRATVEVLVVR